MSLKKFPLIFSALTILFIPSLIILFLFPKDLFYIIKIQYIFPILGLILLKNKSRLTNNSKIKTNNFYLWILKILILQFFLLNIFQSFAHTTNITISHENIFCFFCMLAIIASHLGIIYWREEKFPLIISLTPTITNLKNQRIIQILFTGFFIFTLTLFLVTNLTGILNIKPSINPVILFTTCAVLIFMHHKIWRDLIHYFCRKNYSLGFFIFLIIIFLSMIFFLIKFLLSIFPDHAIINNYNFFAAALIFWGFSLGIIFVASTFLAKISYARKINEIIFTFLISGALAIFIFSHLHLNYQISNLINLSLLIFLLRARNSAFFISGFLPLPKNSVITPRRMIKFIKPFLLGVVTLALGYLCLGILPMEIVLIATALPCFLFYLFMSLGFISKK